MNLILIILLLKVVNYKKRMECAVCLEPYTNPHIMNCGHSLCLSCIKFDTCPICRTVIVGKFPNLSFGGERLKESSTSIKLNNVDVLKQCIQTLNEDIFRGNVRNVYYQKLMNKQVCRHHNNYLPLWCCYCYDIPLDLTDKSFYDTYHQTPEQVHDLFVAKLHNREYCQSGGYGHYVRYSKDGGHTIHASSHWKIKPEHVDKFLPTEQERLSFILMNVEFTLPPASHTTWGN